MKKLTIILSLNVALLMLVGCASNTNEESSTDSSENSSVLESTEKDTTETDKSTSTNEVEESETKDVDDTSSEETVNDSDGTPFEDNASNAQDNKETLSSYSSEQIEYARVWLQLGPNQELDELNVRHIPAGEPINPNDDTSASYPEDVIQLAGARLVDGSVTYSGNGDGTINVYNVPLRWDSSDDLDEGTMRKVTEDIIGNTEQVYIDPSNDEEIIELIKLLNIHN